MVNLSELQISLIAIGVLVIIGVACFNWMQQRQYRERAEKAFGTQHEDVLLGGTGSTGSAERIEPRIWEAPSEDSQAHLDEGSDTRMEDGDREAGKKEETEIRAHLESPPSARPVFSGNPPNMATKAEITSPQDGDGARPEIKPRARTETKAEPRPKAELRVPLPSVEQKPRATRSARKRRIDIDLDGVDYVVTIRSETLIPDAALTDVLQRKSEFAKKVHWKGQKSADAFWNEITAENQSGRGYLNLKSALQLTDRAGPVSELTLSEFRDMVENFAAGAGAVAECPDIQEAHARAILLDEFCAEVDMMVGINIISNANNLFTAAKIHVLAEASGFKLGSEGRFLYRDENNALLFSLGNNEPSPFLPASMRTLTTHGVTFLLDVPRVANGEAVFGQMMHLAEAFADTLEGIIVDDDHVPLNDNGIRKIRQQVSAIQTLMLARGIPAGGETALRLFA